MFKHFACFFIAVFFFLSSTYAQNPKILDSLKVAYDTVKLETTRFLVLADIAYEYRIVNPDTCIALGKKVLKAGEELQQLRVQANGLNVIGIGNFHKGNYTEALACYLRGLSIEEQLGGNRNIAVYLNNIGMIHELQGDFGAALAVYERSLQFMERLGDKQAMGTLLSNMGIIYYNLGNLELALESYQKSLNITTSIGDKQVQSYTLNNIADILSLQGNYAQAIDHYQRSLQLKKEIGDDWAATYTYNGLAKVHLHLQLYEKSIQYAEEGLQIAQRIKALAEIKMLNYTLFEIYKQKGDYVSALAYHENYKQTSDSLFTVEKSRTLANLEAKAENERKGKEIALLNKNQELLAKDNELQKIETERQRNARLALEKQAEADHLQALAKQEQDKRKQDSLRTLAEKAQLEANGLKAKEAQLSAESNARKLEILKDKEALIFQQRINFLVLIGLLLMALLAFFIYRSRQKEKKAKEIIAQQKEEVLQQREETLQINEALVVANRKLDKQSQELQTLNHTKDKIFAIIGHDLRSPVNSLYALLSLLKDNSISQEEFMKVSESLKNGVSGLYFTLNNLLQWAADQMEGLHTQPVVLDMHQIATAVCELFTETAKEKNIRLQNNLVLHTQVWADEDQLTLVLRNLVNNALKFTRTNGEIILSSQDKGDYYEICVQDNGLGMDAETLAQLFQSSPAVSQRGIHKEKGTGLGLMLCQEFVQKNGGHIWAESQLGEGSRFCFTVPKAAIVNPPTSTPV